MDIPQYKVWSVKEKKMYFVGSEKGVTQYLRFYDTAWFLYISDYRGDINIAGSSDGDILIAYTGYVVYDKEVEDSTGHMIYTGDIVSTLVIYKEELCSIIGVVTYDKNEWSIEWLNAKVKDYKTSLKHWLGKDKSVLRLMGNAYENEDLVTKYTLKE